MKTFFLSFLLLLLPGSVFLKAQTSLPDSKRNSSELYIYKAKVEDLRQIYLKDKSPDENMLHSFITSYERDREKPLLPKGNYFIIGSDGNHLVFNDYTVDDFNFKIIPGEQLMLCLYDSSGNIIHDAVVKCGSSKLTFDKTTHTYNKKKVKDGQIIEVNNNGIFHYIEIEKDFPFNYYSRNNVFEKSKWTIRQKWYNIKCSIIGIFDPSERLVNSKYSGFIVFNKPKYKPGETVKLKAYMTKKNGKLYDKPVDVGLYSYYPNKIDTTLVRNLSPYRPGMYHYEFILSDSLNLKLDVNYNIGFKTKNRKEYDLSGNFRFEEYELKSTHFSIDTKKTVYTSGDSIIVTVKATDENGMALFGGKVEIQLTPSTINKQDMNSEQSAFIPDLLWTETIEMNDLSEKEIIIPDSIFPYGISLGFQVKCIYLSADNEKVEKSKTLFRKSNDYLIDFSLEKGILTIKELHKGESTQTIADITVSGENGEVVLKNSFSLPYQLTVPWIASDITVKTKNAKETFSLEDVKEDQLGYNFYRRSDSIYLKVENPANIPFWYTLRKRNKEIAKGYTTQLDYSVKDNDNEGYAVQLSYLFGKERCIEEKLSYVQKNMSIEVSTPTSVYPGQTANVTVSVIDKNGKPVENADITAYSFTSKFEGYSMPNLPIKGTARYANRFNNIRYETDENGIYNQKSFFSWERWKHFLSLDTIEYYKFLYPNIFYAYEEPSADGDTQIAPYLVIDGALQGIHMLWIDDRLHYVEQAQQLDNYLFRVSPGSHNLRFRTHNREVSIYNIVIKAGTKTIMSFDAGIPYVRKNIFGDSFTPFALVSKILKKKERGVLSKKEIDYLSTELITIDNNFGNLVFSNQRYLGLPAYISTGNTNYYLTPVQKINYNNILRANVNAPILAGPFPYRNIINGLPDMATLYSDRNPLTIFQIEGGYNYTFYENYQKLKSWEHSPIIKRVSAFVPQTDFKSGLLSEGDIYYRFNQTIINNLISFSGRVDDINTYDNNKKNACQMSLYLGPDIKPALIFIVPQNKEDILDYCLYYGGTRHFRDLPEGKMNVYLIFSDTTSYTTSVSIRKNGQNYLRLDSIGRDDDKKITEIAFNIFQRNTTKIFAKNPYSNIQKDTVIEVITTHPGNIFKNDNFLKGIITGTIIDNSGEKIIGASVLVKGKSIGTVTDFNGRFELTGASKGDKIEITYIGYVPVTVNYMEGYDYNIVLIEDFQALGDIVVVGFGSQRKSNMTGVITTVNELSSSSFDIQQVLEGKLAGLMVRGAGAESSNVYTAPLIIVDGLPFDGNIDDLDQNTITALNILKNEDAISIYGSKAANGLIMIQTNAFKKSNKTQGIEMIEPGNSMRRNFHDDAFWQPALRTNNKGEVSFEVTYPDDITNWNAYFLAIGNRKQADKKQMTIQSFKALTARLSTPRFAIRGDSLNAIGKIANHLNDSIEVNRTVTLEGFNKETTINMTASYTEQIPVIVSTGDSITLAYSIRRSNGYFDGEERSFPIFEQGLLQSYGEFKIINDTVTTLFNINPHLGTVTLHAEASSMDVFLREIDKIDRYPYLCNEQIASKIKALLAKKNIATLFGKEFKDDNKIKNLISRLKNNSNAEGLWGWWNKSKTEFWISKQIIYAMLDAEKAGYKTGTDTLKIRSVLEQQLKEGIANLPMMAPFEGSFAKQELLDRLVLLKSLNASIDYPAYYAQIDYHLKSKTVNEKLKEMLLFSILGMNEKINMDTLMHYSRKTMLGSMFWGEEKESRFLYALLLPFNNNIESTLMAYSILKNKGGYEQELEKIRNYFFECRHTGSWQNTYEASRIIEMILPDMYNPSTNYSEVSMIINNKKVTAFSFTEKLDTNQPVHIKKEGVLPLFVTAYQQEWNQNPQQESSKGFSIQTVFKENQDTVSILKAGKPVNLEVILKVDADADYVQIEVPIPAGCSYESKTGRTYGKEAHREYFKEKVTIFCNRLNRGEHQFIIDLIPRFTGKYILNPAKVELMYFPTFYGNEIIKTMEIY